MFSGSVLTNYDRDCSFLGSRSFLSCYTTLLLTVFPDRETLTEIGAQENLISSNNSPGGDYS